MPRLKLTKTFVNTRSAREKDVYELRGAAIPGFLLKVTLTGRSVRLQMYTTLGLADAFKAANTALGSAAGALIKPLPRNQIGNVPTRRSLNIGGPVMPVNEVDIWARSLATTVR
jgi:hypothetical protein